MMYTITLNDGTEIRDLYVNGTNFVSGTELDTSIFTDSNLSVCKISDGNATHEYRDLAFIQQMEYHGEYYIALRQKSDRELEDETILDNIADLLNSVCLLEIGGEIL